MATLVFLFLLLLLLLPLANCMTSPIDVQALKQIKHAVEPATIPPGSCLSSWDFSVDPCDSLYGQRFTCGFRCDQQSPSGQKRVTELTLDSAGYSGILSPSVGNLRFLTELQLTGNSFNGTIPPSLANLPYLQRLTLSQNSFTGVIPPELGRLSALQEIYLDNNHLTGTLPDAFANLKSLRRLEIQGNNISGVFPDLSNLQSLNFIDASDNRLSGRFPNKLPVSLLEIAMRNNMLEGGIPPGIGTLRWLQVLDLSRNRLSGTVPASAFEHPSLEQITLSSNGFDKLETPASSGSKSGIIALDLKGNRLAGTLPAFFGKMPRLSALSLENNLLTGTIPAEYAARAAAAPGKMVGVEPFARLMLAGNYLFGPIPAGLLRLKPGVIAVSLADNCIFRCPNEAFFCQGARQKSLSACRSVNPRIPAT